MWQNLPRPHLAQPYLLQTELLYPLIIIFICLFIFFKTKPLYQLSAHKGIYFFRQTFLFFALAYMFRFLPTFFRLADFQIIHFRIGFAVGLYIFGFASSMALFSIMRSIIWKDISSSFLTKSYAYYILALLLPFSIFFFSLRFFLYTQFILLVLILVLSYMYHQTSGKRKKISMYYTYLLLAIMWLLNVAAITLPPFASELKIILYFTSLILFMIILYRVLLKSKVR